MLDICFLIFSKSYGLKVMVCNIIFYYHSTCLATRFITVQSILDVYKNYTVSVYSESCFVNNGKELNEMISFWDALAKQTFVRPCRIGRGQGFTRIKTDHGTALNHREHRNHSIKKRCYLNITKPVSFLKQGYLTI